MTSARDEAHWLLRLSAAEWIDAARRELTLGADHEAHRRRVITHLRRGAGMGLNACLAAAHGEAATTLEETCRVWGRSYMDHLRAVASDAPLLELPATVRPHAGALVALQFQATTGALVSIRSTGSDNLDDARDAARVLVDACAQRSLHATLNP